MNIYCIQTGKVKVKKNQIRKPAGPVPGMAQVILGKEWSGWLPILAWIIDHPEGIIVVDTGETCRVHDKNYFPSWQPYYRTSVRFDVKPEDEIGYQLKEMGIRPEKDVSRVIMTHLHTDHAGGMYHFPKARFLMHKKEYTGALGLRGKIAGYLPHRWPKWLTPEYIVFENKPYGPFDRQQFITSDRKIRILPTPGHVPNHVSVVVEENGISYFLAGDTSYNLYNMRECIPDGVGSVNSINTLEKINLLARERPLVYLPSHDPASRKRLEESIPVNFHRKGSVA
jgi:glyoxylase-like metal-dependent hydrolase (beta-lactamase superfamily II)